MTPIRCESIVLDMVNEELVRKVYAAAHEINPEDVENNDEGLEEIRALLDAERRDYESQIQWWVRTAEIRGEQYRALLALVHSQQEAIKHITILTPAVIETYVNRWVSPVHTEVKA